MKVSVTDIQSALSTALQVPVQEVSPELSFGDIPQWDSMGHMEIMLLLESEYGIEVNADTISSLTSVPVICAYLERLDQSA